MAANVEQSSLGLEKLFNRAKKFYSQQSKSNAEQANPNRNGVSKEARRKAPQRQEAPVGLGSPKVGKSPKQNDRKILNEPNSQAIPLTKPQELMKISKSKDVNAILTPEDAHPEIRSRNSSLQGVKNSQNFSESYCKPEICKNYALSTTLNSDKLTEIINNSIKAAVKNLANDTSPPCWKEGKKQETVTPIPSSCFNDTCTGRLKSIQNKKNVTNYTQYSEQEISCIRPNVSGNIVSIYGNNGSKKSYNSHKRTSPRRQSPTCCIPPSSKSVISSVICHQSVSQYKQIMCPCAKKQSDKSSKSCKPCKPRSKPCKPCSHVKADNRKMTGNVNIYICSEGNDAGGNKKTKSPKSTCNSTTVTNASCACSSTDVCACQSTSSSKTIRDLMEKRKKLQDITLKCICGKLPSDCQCLVVQSKNNESEELCLCDMSSLNPTTSNETCRDPAVDYNLQTPSDSISTPQGDYCTRRVRSGSSSRNEPYCTRQNCDTFNQVAELERNSEIYNEKLKFTTGNSGRGDALQECLCCETFPNYSEGKFNVCGCCDINNINNPAPQNQLRERYVPPTYQNNVDYSRRVDDACNCCAYENESVYSSGRKSDIDRSVCCKNKNVRKPRVQQPKNEYCTKPCDSPRNSVCDGKNREQSGYSNFCIMEEDEPCDVASCHPPCAKKENLNNRGTSQEDSNRFLRKDSDVHEEEEVVIDRQEPINDGKQNDEAIVARDDVPASQTVAKDNLKSVAELVKSYSNADKSTSSNMVSPITPVSPLPSVSKAKKSVAQPKTSLEKESKRSSLRWSFEKAKSFIGGTSKPVEPKKNKSSVKTPKSQDAAAPKKPVKNLSTPKSIKQNSENVIEKTANSNSTSVVKNISAEKTPLVVKSPAGGNSLIAIKSSVIGEDKSKELVQIESTKSKLSSSRLGSLISERKSPVQSATNETSRSQDDDQFGSPCCCGAADSDMCTCQCPQCPCCNRPQEDCGCNTTQDRLQEQSCKGCKQTKRLCCCCDVNNQQKSYRTLSEDDEFRVCTLCCRPEIDCCCNSCGQTSKRSRSPSNSYNKTVDCCGLVYGKSQICVYCDEPRDKCTCRSPIKKCSYCGIPIDVCNCQDITDTCNTCNHNENICQCNGRIIQNSDGGDQSICVTAWKPRRNVRKYFSRNPGERDNPDCSCCDNVKPYGSDELPYQRLSVFSDVMTELQQKMSELPCCTRCGKTPCCCYLQESKSHSSPINEARVCNMKQKKSRSRSPPCRHCPGTSPCKCGGRKNSSLSPICDRCRTTPCRCRKSRSTQRKPQAKCYYCKCSPCRCETSKTNATSPKSCKCSGSPPRSQAQVSSLPDQNFDRNLPSPRLRSCRCRCGSPSCGSPSRGQERPCG